MCYTPCDMDVPVQTESSTALTVVIPTLNEERHVVTTLRCVRHAASQPVEILVVDGGSCDATTDLAQKEGVTLLRSSTGRARQMNAGAAVAQGSVLLFLHADTILPLGYDRIVVSTLNDSAVALGAFRLRFDSSQRSLQWIAWGANLRSRWLAMPYGDQAIFLRAQTFRELGGFADIPIMEDVDLVRRARRCGSLELINSAVTTSARRWETNGVWQTTITHQLMAMAYGLGFSPTRMAKWRGARLDADDKRKPLRSGCWRC